MNIALSRISDAARIIQRAGNISENHVPRRLLRHRLRSRPFAGNDVRKQNNKTRRGSRALHAGRLPIRRRSSNVSQRFQRENLPTRLVTDRAYRDESDRRLLDDSERNTLNSSPTKIL